MHDINDIILPVGCGKYTEHFYPFFSFILRGDYFFELYYILESIFKSIGLVLGGFESVS